MVLAVISGLVVFVLASSLFSDSSYIETLMNPTLNMASFILHAFLGFASFASGIILVVILFRDRAIPGHSNTIAKIVTILWILAYIVGAFFFVILHII